MPKREPSFVTFLRDQLSELPSLRARGMFGGYGLYSGEIFFAIVADETVYFKTDDQSRPAYVEQGSGPFVYETKGGAKTLKNYYAVPLSVVEDSEMLTEWARRAIRVGG